MRVSFAHFSAGKDTFFINFLFQSILLAPNAQLPRHMQNVPHYESTRPDFTYHTITITIGRLADVSKMTSVCPHISSQWAFKLAGKYLGGFFCGLSSLLGLMKR